MERCVIRVVAGMVFIASSTLGWAIDLPVSTTFDSDLDGWTKSPPSESVLKWDPDEGHPPGCAHYWDCNPTGGDIVAPAKFLGDWSSFDGIGMIRYEHIILDLGSTPQIADYEIRISGPTDSAVFQAPHGTVGEWVQVAAPVEASYWTVTGNWNDLLLNVIELRIRIELVSNSEEGDQDAIDNIFLIDASTSVAFPGMGSASWSQIKSLFR